MEYGQNLGVDTFKSVCGGQTKPPEGFPPLGKAVVKPNVPNPSTAGGYYTGKTIKPIAAPTFF